MKLLSSREKTEHIKVDASRYNYGRLCSYVALLLRSKHRVDFNCFNKVNTVVEIFNIEEVKFSKENKLDNKIFYRYTGYIGGLKTRTLRFYLKNNRIKECFKISVRKMLSNTNGYQNIVEKNIHFKNE